MKPTTRQGQIEHILQQLSHQELKDFVLDKALQDSDFRDTLLICFADLLGSEEPAEPKYQQMLADMMQRHVNVDGYVHSASANSLTTAVHNLLDVARKATTPTRETLDLCLAVISSLLPKLAEKMEDPEEHIYSLMNTSCTILWECYSVLPPERQQALFDRILQEYTKPLYLDLDLDSHLLALLKDWAKHDNKRQSVCLHQLEKWLKTLKQDHWRKHYLLEQTNTLLTYWKT
ncbi:MAG: hypothetical protein QJT81_16825 [Candidatus Thiothrix putei]|uniref:Uncharacterized protein n=1 Tax=Candidatus Thiothrix putei TaxID=3080811 RepID=A0AA95KII7_9GAMM|nr:MAG: hypothetical protein QJT81_16825 [Candidatus Thiothrix putei]